MLSDSPQQPLPFHFQFLAGAIAGVSEILTMYPLDVVKTRFQLQTAQTAQYTSIVDCFSKIIKQEGFSRLYRGIVPPVMVEAPKRATKFAANAHYSLILQEVDGLSENGKLTRMGSVAAGVMAGCTEAFLVSSFELVKIRLQDKGNAGRYNGTLDAVAKIYRQEGALAFFNGLSATVWRHATWNGGYFGIIYSIRKALPAPATKGEELRNNFVAGACGGTFGTMLNTPFDVVKTRIQNQVEVKKYRFTIPSLVTIAKEEGAAALYKGFVPKVLRLGPGGGILLVVFEVVSTWMRKNL